jgi:hypothetical protein
MKSSLFWNVTQRRLVDSNRRFGTTYRFLLGVLPLKMDQIGCPETSVTTSLPYVKSQKSEKLKAKYFLHTKLERMKDLSYNATHS